MFINNQYIFIQYPIFFNFQLFYLSFVLIFVYYMDTFQTEQDKKIDAKIKAWTYFYKDFVSGDAKCKICYAVIKTYNQAIGLLQLHLEQVHGIDFQKNLTKDEQVKSLNPQLLPNLGTSAPHKIQNSLNFLNLPNGQHDWLSPFIEQVSEQQSQPVDQDRDQFKFLIHSTQYTDPLKYTQFNRYSEEQLAQIREQMNQLANFNKTPAMVTLAQRQLFQSNIRVKQSPQQILKQIIGKVKQNFDVYYWKNCQQTNQSEGQLNIRQNCEKTCTPKVVQSLIKKDYEVIEIRKLKKQNNKQNQVLFQESKQENKQNQWIERSQNMKDCSSYIFINEKMKQYYSKYADSVSIVAFEAQHYIILLIFVQDWRSIYENVGIILFENLQTEASQRIQANFALYFHSISSKLPKSIFFLSFLEQSQRNNNISLKIKDLIDHFNKEVSSSGQSLIFFAQIKCKQNVTEENRKKKNVQLIQSLYQKLQQKIAQKIAKYNEQFSELRSIEMPVIFSQLAIHSIQDKKRNNRKSTRDDGSTKQIVINMKINDYINPQATTRNHYQGFITQEKRIKTIRNFVKSFVQMVNHQQTNLGFILDTIFNSILCNRYFQIGIQVEKGLEHKKFPGPIKQLQQLLSPNIMEILHEIYLQSQSITHLTYRTSKLVDVYSVILKRQDETLLEKDKIENVHSNPAKVKIFKNTVFYHDNIRAWVCNCHRISLYGLPCYHILKVVEKMKGSIYYYINQRWKPDYNDILLFKADYDQWISRTYTRQPLEI